MARGRFSRSWPGEDSADHSHYTHDAISEATISRLHDARHFWRPGHKTFSGFIKHNSGNKTEEDQGSRRQGRAKYKRGRKKKTQRQGKPENNKGGTTRVRGTQTRRRGENPRTEKYKKNRHTK